MLDICAGTGRSSPMGLRTGWKAIAALPLLFACGHSAALGEPVPRAAPAAGSVIARKTGEEVRFFDVSAWNHVDLNQDLLIGDELRTNAVGQLAILFSDDTQIRLGRNSSLLVRQMGATGDTVLDLNSGSIWARAQRGGRGLKVETPAAAAAIRGTDWSLTVDGDKTSLAVLEGTVELTNAQGSVQVRQGEAAVARIGQAPQKVIIVNSDDREQMLFYLPLRDAFVYMQASPLTAQEMRETIDRIEQISEQARSAEDWLTLAEAQFTLDGRQKSAASLDRARAMSLSTAGRARLDLMDAMVAGAERRFSDAARLFARAVPGLDPKRASVADFGGYFARALAYPDRLEKQPRHVTGPNGAFGQAYAAGFLDSIRASLEVLKEAERKYPDDPRLPGYRSAFAFIINDREQVKEAMGRALALDPNQPYGLWSLARYQGGIEGDIDAAIATLEKAVKVAPGWSTLWNDLGNAQDARGDWQSAEKALKRAIELDPEDALARSNLAIVYLQQDRVREAKREIDRAMASDPGFDLALVARGRYHLSTGELEKATEDLLAGTVANPAYAQGQLALAIAQQEQGNRIAAQQALDNADRLDPNDPVVPSLRASIAMDEYDSDGAIAAAQEYMRRLRAIGADHAAISFNHDAGSTLNNAFRLQGLNAWGQYYGDITFDPFTGSSYVDQTLRGSVNPFLNNYLYGGDGIEPSQNKSTFSSFMQGLLYDPHMLAGPSARPYYIRYPFAEVELGYGISTYDGDSRPIYQGSWSSFANWPFPVSSYVNLEWTKTPISGASPILPSTYDGDTELVNGIGYFTATPTPDNRIVLYGQHTQSEFDLTSRYPAGLPLLNNYPFTYDRDERIKSTAAGAGWSHTISFENVVNAAFFYGDVQGRDLQTLTLDGGEPGYGRMDARQTSYIGAVNHTIATGNLTWRYGLEGGIIDAQAHQAGVGSAKSRIDYGRLYVDVLHDIDASLQAEYGLFGTYADGDGVDTRRLDPRLGVAYAPADGHWLRAAYIAQSYDFDVNTLAPVSTVGLQPNQIGLNIDGDIDTIAARWDAEWNDRLFTAVDFQHQNLDGFGIAYPNIWQYLLAPGPLALSDGRLDRVSATANIHLGNGFGLSGTLAYIDSENQDPSSLDKGSSLPFVPEWAGQVALTWVNEANVKATLAANYIGTRLGNETFLVSNEGTADPADDRYLFPQDLAAFWTLDASVTWEPFDKRVEMSLAAFNLLDEDFEVATGIPGWGRSFKGTLKVRF
ncbi:FecR domain-containing protein [Rhizobium sp. TRM96647]|uniref:FecR domain-containing protein n=1 Tax=unclassified Rhizobium TaxID=2613769 RepID=UPI0021E820C5|nr:MULTISPECIES: FecR domain-containing protein [unclassified Rhizobium]MCV3735946.1 FecR domain-containing protein [Rhizobium sp. TRM96647]MCV3758392.1 FecR domain-containing protein [Rhizobium sp. TRM96650]